MSDNGDDDDDDGNDAAVDREHGAEHGGNGEEDDRDGGAPLVQHPLERRQARDGGWYTMEDFMQYYGSSVPAGWYYWERAVRKVVPPAAAQPASSERAQRNALDATAATSHAEDRDFPDADDLREIAEQVKRTPQEIEEHMQHCAGAAFHAAILAGKEALAKGKPKQEVAAVIESAGANVCGLEKWRRSAFSLLAEAFLIGTRAERFGTPQEAAELQYMRTGDRHSASSVPQR